MDNSLRRSAQCALYDVWGECWTDTTGGIPEAVPYELAVATDVRIRLDSTCRTDWMTQWLANQLSRTVAQQVAQMQGSNAAAKRVAGWAGPAAEHFPKLETADLRGTEIRIGALTGTTLRLSNIALIGFDKPAIEYGACWDYLEWWEHQDPFTKLMTNREPDSLQIGITNIRTRVSYDWVAEQSALLGSLPVGWGKGFHEIVGILKINIDLHELTRSAITECKGKFEIGQLHLEPHPSSAISPALAYAVMTPYSPIIASDIASYICYGASVDGSGTALLSPLRASISFSDGTFLKGEYKGIVRTVDDFLIENRALFQLVQNDGTREWVPHPPPPPAPPPPPPGNCWAPCGGVSGLCPSFCGAHFACCKTGSPGAGCPAVACEGYHCCVPSPRKSTGWSAAIAQVEDRTRMGASAASTGVKVGAELVGDAGAAAASTGTKVGSEIVADGTEIVADAANGLSDAMRADPEGGHKSVFSTPPLVAEVRAREVAARSRRLAAPPMIGLGLALAVLAVGALWLQRRRRAPLEMLHCDTNDSMQLL